MPGDSTSVLASYRAGADSFDTIDSLNVAGMDNDGLEKTVRMVATTKDIYMDIGVVAESIDVDDLAPIPENKILPELLPTVKSKDDIDTASGSGKVTVVVNNSKQAEQPVKEDEVLAPVRVKPHSAEEASAPKQKEVILLVLLSVKFLTCVLFWSDQSSRTNC